MLRLTEAGEGLLAAALPVWRETHRMLDARLPDIERLRADLRAVASEDVG